MSRKSLPPPSVDLSSAAVFQGRFRRDDPPEPESTPPVQVPPTSVEAEPVRELEPAPVAATAKPAARKKRKAAPRVQPVRMTTDLTPAMHRWFRRWCAETADDLGLPSVKGSEVVRALIAELQSDAALAERVTERLHD